MTLLPFPEIAFPRTYRDLKQTEGEGERERERERERGRGREGEGEGERERERERGRGRKRRDGNLFALFDEKWQLPVTIK